MYHRHSLMQTYMKELCLWSVIHTSQPAINRIRVTLKATGPVI